MGDRRDMASCQSDLDQLRNLFKEFNQLSGHRILHKDHVPIVSRVEPVDEEEVVSEEEEEPSSDEEEELCEEEVVEQSNDEQPAELSHEHPIEFPYDFEFIEPKIEKKNDYTISLYVMVIAWIILVWHTYDFIQYAFWFQTMVTSTQRVIEVLQQS